MAAIGSLFLSLGVNTSALDSGLTKAAKKAQMFGLDVAKHLTMPLRAMTGALGIPASLARGLLQPVQQLLSSVPLVGGALGALAGGGAGFTANLKEQMSAIVGTSREAKMLGIGIDTLAGIQLVAGAGAEGLGRSMMHLQHEIGSAAAGSKEARSKFAGLGLDADKLAGEGFEAALGEIADKFVSLKDPVQQATLAYELFGRRGESWIPILARGSAGLKEGRERAVAMGLAFSQLDAGEVRKAVVAMRTIEGTVKGVFQQAAVGISPYISAVGIWFNNLVKEAGGVGPFMKQAFEKGAEGLASLVDALGDLIDELRTLKELTSAKGVGKQLFENLSPLTPLKKLWGFGKDLFASKDEGGMTGGRGDPIRSIAKQVKAGAAIDPVEEAAHDQALHAFQLTAKIGDLESELRKQIGTMGQSSDAAKLWELRVDGATEAQLVNTRSLIDQKNALEGLGKAYEKVGVMAAYQAKAQDPALKADLAMAHRQALLAASAGQLRFYDRQAEGNARIMDSAQALDMMIKQRDRVHVLAIGSGGKTEGKAALKELDEQINKLKELGRARDNALRSKALDVKVGLIPETTKFKSQFEDLGAMFSQGLLSKGEFAGGALAAIDAKAKELGLNPGGEAKLAGGAEAGSVEAQSTINKFLAAPTTDDPVAVLKQIYQILQDTDKRQEQRGDRLESAMDRRGNIKALTNF